MAEDPQPQPPVAGTSLEVFVAFLRLGLTAFGGPIAHLAYFRREFVDRRGWIDEAAFADLLALCHFLPGPASSQMGMGIGLRRAGLAGALAAWLGFTAPAAAAMIALGCYAAQLEGTWGRGWLHGLQVAAAAVVLQAVISMARTLAVGPIRAGMAVGAAFGLVVAHGPVAQVCALAAGGLFGWAMLREEAVATPQAPSVQPRFLSLPIVSPWLAFGLFAVLLAALPALAVALGDPMLGLASALYRTGALVFGGGHVVLPMMEAEVVARGWLDRDTFLAGYGAAQALPGPLFAFAGFVGAAQDYAPDALGGGWLTGLMSVVAIFLPGFLLLLGALPLWDRLKTDASARGAMAGVCAVVVGLLAAALWDPMLKAAVQRPSDWALVGAAFIFLSVARLPPWLVVIGFAAATGVLLR